MGKMKEIFTQQMEDEIVGMSNAEYQDWLRAQENPPTQEITGIPNGNTMSDTDDGEPATQEDKETEHDAWWNSLTDEQKQQLYDGQEAVFELSIEEMNHDLSFGK